MIASTPEETLKATLLSLMPDPVVMLVVTSPAEIEIVVLVERSACNSPFAKKEVNHPSTLLMMLEPILMSAMISPIVTFSRSKPGYQN